MKPDLQMEALNFDVPIANVDEINELLRRYGVKFGIYKNGVFKEQLFPFDPIPRIITAQDFTAIEKGLIQRVDALNMFIYDIYHDKKIIADKIVPEDFVYISSGYLPQCEGITPPKNIYSHISGIDLVLGKDGEWYILEDNLRIPSGASYPLIARELTRVASPKAFTDNPIVDNRNYAQLLRDTMDNVNCGGINAILTPGRYNAAYFEHSYLAELSGAALVSNGSKEEFFRSFIFDEDNPSSVAASLVKAYDNGIVLREEISTEALSFLQMAMDKLEHTKHSLQALCLSLLPLVDILFGFWGCVGEYVYDEEIKTIIECGKYVERLDLYFRMNYQFSQIEREFGRLCASLRNVPKNTPYRYNTKQLCVLVEVMGMGDSYTANSGEAISALGRLFEPVRRSVMAG